MTWTLLNILNWTQDYFAKNDIENPRLEAEILLAHSLGLNRVQLYVQFDRPLAEKERDDYKKLIKRRINQEPVAYIVGDKEFYSRKFFVSPAVLIPRPETELLVEISLELFPDREKKLKILDIGTGSGVLAITLQKEFPFSLVTGIDISEPALKMAQKNAENLKASVQFEKKDLFENLDFSELDLIVSNPPYVDEKEMEKLPLTIKNYEPEIALRGGKDGLDFYKRIAQLAPSFLKKEGFLILEIGNTQAASVLSLFQDWPFLQIRKDYFGQDRILIAGNKNG